MVLLYSFIYNSLSKATTEICQSNGSKEAPSVYFSTSTAIAANRGDYGRQMIPYLGTHV